MKNERDVNRKKGCVKGCLLSNPVPLSYPRKKIMSLIKFVASRRRGVRPERRQK